MTHKMDHNHTNKISCKSLTLIWHIIYMNMCPLSLCIWTLRMPQIQCEKILKRPIETFWCGHSDVVILECCCFDQKSNRCKELTCLERHVAERLKHSIHFGRSRKRQTDIQCDIKCCIESTGVIFCVFKGMFSTTVCIVPPPICL